MDKPSKEARAKEEADFQAEFAKIVTARKAIVAHTGGKRGVQGVIDCPIDGGRLRFSVAGVNGHIHAACSGDNCVRWME